MNQILYFVKKLNAYAGKVLYINLLGMFMISLLDGVGLLMLIPMINMSGLVNLSGEDTPLAAIIALFQGLPNSLGLIIILSIYVLLVISQGILSRQITIHNTTIQHGFFRHLRNETYELLLNANWKFFIENRKSDLLNILTSQIATASAGTNSFLQFVSSLVFTVIQMIFAFWISPTITLFVLLSGAVLILFSRGFIKRSFAIGNRTFESGKEYLAGVTDQINGIKDIKSNALEESRFNWYQTVTQKMLDEQVDYIKLKTKSQFAYKMASAVLIAVFIFVAFHLFKAQSTQLMLIIVIFSRLWPRVTGIQSSLEQIATTIPSYNAVIHFQEECKKSQEHNGGKLEDSRMFSLQKRIVLQNVSFSYNQKVYALQDIHLTFPVNRMTAVVGRSGAGKSTLIDLLMGLNKPEKGQVLIDGKPLEDDQLVSWRKTISYVSQDPYLFNGSIRDNLTLVAPNANEEQIWEALEFASAAEFVSKLPNGLDTLIGDRGIKLSGGERQRLVLARAMLRNPSILVLDEATSALDTENETNIQEALERLKGKITIVVIAHRLSTIRNADQVIVLEQGKVIQNGKFGQLANEQKGMFNKLLKNQLEALP